MKHCGVLLLLCVYVCAAIVLVEIKMFKQEIGMCFSCLASGGYNILLSIMKSYLSCPLSYEIFIVRRRGGNSGVLAI